MHSQDHGASGRSSGSALLSTAASSSITCGSASVPAFQLTLSTSKAEYGAKRYSSSPWTLVFLTRLTWAHLRSGSMRTRHRHLTGIEDQPMNLRATCSEKDVARNAG